MERDPLIPLTPAQPAAAPEVPPRVERGGFFEKLRKKAKHSPENRLPKNRERAEAPAPPDLLHPERRIFGKNILRLSLLEQHAEASKTATLAAMGLGVIAVLVTGTGYFGSRRRERETQAAALDRAERQRYYERLSTFTHQQAERTRETARDLKEVVAQSETPELAPVMRVEAADTIERVTGQQTGSAGTGFFGGGGGGIARGTGPSDLNPPAVKIDPNSREARQLEALRKIEQARLRQNAWLYSAALVGAMVTLGVIALLLG